MCSYLARRTTVRKGAPSDSAFDGTAASPYFRFMFRRFREKIERALERKEQERPLTRDDVDQLLKGMRQELIDLRSRIPRLEKESEALRARAQREIQRAELAHNKAQEADRGARPEEAQPAIDAARRALEHAEDLRGQADEVRGEVERLKAEYAEKLEQLKYAERNRGALLARSRRAGTARKLDELLRGPEGGIARFERAEEDIEGAEDLAAAEREVDAALGDRPSYRELETDLELRKLESAKKADEIEERLADLKRQMESEQ
jgi:phage shock protein A